MLRQVIGVLMDALKSWGVRISVPLKAGNNNLPDPKLLNEVQDRVWNDPRWKAGEGVTHCNQAALAVANGMGCHVFDPAPGKDPYLADQLWYLFMRGQRDNTSKFLEKDMEDVQALANQGSLVFAICPSWLLQEEHGHVVTITAGDPVYSPNLDKQVPVCMNVATAVLSSRRIGINYAFPLKRALPKFYVWKESL